MALTSEQQRALALLREGLSTAEVAERLGLPRPTVWGWQRQLVEFTDTLQTTSSGKDSLFRGPFTPRDKLRIGMPLLLTLLAAFFVYLGYCR